MAGFGSRTLLPPGPDHDIAFNESRRKLFAKRHFPVFDHTDLMSRFFPDEPVGTRSILMI